jgi:hypothetical protein
MNLQHRQHNESHYNNEMNNTCRPYALGYLLQSCCLELACTLLLHSCFGLKAPDVKQMSAE